MIEKIGRPAMLEQLAKEASELAQACLELAKKERGENPTPKSKSRINQECKATSGEWIEGVGLGNIHDIWNLMYHDMKALYTLEQLVNNHYRTRGIEQAEGSDKK